MGAQLNSRCDITKDLNMRMGAATNIWRKLDKLWKGTNNRIKDKLNIYFAVVRSKIAYSLETAPLNSGHKKILGAFQQKALGQVMGIEPTFIDRSMTNSEVLEYANTVMSGLNSTGKYNDMVRKEGQNHRPKLENFQIMCRMGQ